MASSMKVLVFNQELCDGCGVCERTCSSAWFKVEDVAKSALRIFPNDDQAGRFRAVTCTQCGECIDACPTIAIARDKRGIVRIRKAECVGCLSCVGFCPLEAMRIDSDQTVPFKCVACGKCVEACPVGALSIQDLNDAQATKTEILSKVVA
jgi:anaerobic carbon-monoxide dehydrogenase iron sulfur subunit